MEKLTRLDERIQLYCKTRGVDVNDFGVPGKLMLVDRKGVVEIDEWNLGIPKPTEKQLAALVLADLDVEKRKRQLKQAKANPLYPLLQALCDKTGLKFEDYC